jgi:hypothetical protein
MDSTYEFYRFTTGGRRGGKGSGPTMLVAGTIADPITLDEHDLYAFTQDELDALEHAVFAPGVEVWRIDGYERRIEIRAKRPCVTTLP